MTFLRRVVMLFRSRKLGRYPKARWTNCAFGTIQASLALLVLLSLVHPSRAFAANSDLETVLTGSRQRIEKLDYRVTGRLTRVEANGKRTNYKFVAKAHWFPDGLRVLCEILGSGSEKTSLLLHMTVSGHVTIEAATSWREGCYRVAIRTLERLADGNRLFLRRHGREPILLEEAGTPGT